MVNQQRKRRETTSKAFQKISNAFMSAKNKASLANSEEVSQKVLESSAKNEVYLFSVFIMSHMRECQRTLYLTLYFATS